MRLLGCIVTTCVASSAAYADGVTDRVAKGEDLAKQGKWTEAIENFKAADKIERRAKHACLIALAYTRRELWPQAEMFLAQCKERATSSDPLPDWVPLAEQQLEERLRKAKVATVQITIKPEALARQAAIGVSSFEPDETFSPRAIHLPRGTHLITATVPGHEPSQQTLEIVDDTPKEVVIDFETKPLVVRETAKPAPIAKASPSKIPLIVMAAGGAIVLGGAGYHLLAFKPARDDLANAADGAEYDRLAGEFDSKRTTTIALYGIGAAAIATGVVLKYTLFKHEERAPMLGAAPVNGGGLVVLSLTR